MRGNVELVVCAAPLADRCPRIVEALVRVGWQVGVTASLNAVHWLDVDAIEVAAGSPVVTRSRSPQQARRRPRPDAVMVVPGTFNTLNKLRAGISDTPALGVLNDAVGIALPLLVVPMISERLVRHPAWIETYRWLGDTGVAVLDPSTGRFDELKALASGTGSDVAQSFDAGLLGDWLTATLT